mmetsp:Transcript_7124/g.14545  ORF Transcript_7124/g.14545 Transcript_7124/m.14545 type:complete len:212 (+) Transcript_7124:209-844(+)
MGFVFAHTHTHVCARASVFRHGVCFDHRGIACVRGTTAPHTTLPHGPKQSGRPSFWTPARHRRRRRHHHRCHRSPPPTVPPPEAVPRFRPPAVRRSPCRIPSLSWIRRSSERPRQATRRRPQRRCRCRSLGNCRCRVVVAFVVAVVARPVAGPPWDPATARPWGWRSRRRCFRLCHTAPPPAGIRPRSGLSARQCPRRSPRGTRRSFPGRP